MVLPTNLIFRPAAPFSCSRVPRFARVRGISILLCSLVRGRPFLFNYACSLHVCETMRHHLLVDAIPKKDKQRSLSLSLSPQSPLPNYLHKEMPTIYRSKSRVANPVQKYHLLQKGLY